MVKAIISGALGLLISMVGIDPVAGAPRFTFGMDRLLDGVSFVAVIVGVFGLSEILSYRKDAETPLVHAPGMRSLLPTRTEWRRSAPAMARGTCVGFDSASFPGMTGSVSSLRPTPRKRSSPASASSARARSKGSPVPKRPTTPTPMPP